FGVRPLFYAAAPGGGLVVGNTPGALRAVRGVGQELDEVAVADYLLFGMSMDADATLFSAVRALRRGHRGRWSAAEGVRIHPYWTPSARPELRLRDGGEYVEAFRGLLGAAVRDRVRGSPVSVEMSGGLDSTLLAAFTQRELQRAGVAAGVRGWCVSHAAAFADPEPPLAGIAARHLGIPLRVFDAGRVPALDGGFALRAAPLLPLAPISHAVAREMLGHSRIALSGFDGDALLKVSFGPVWAGMLRRGAVGGLAGALLSLASVAAHNRRLPRIHVRSTLRRRRWPRAEWPVPGWLREDFAARVGLRERADALSAAHAAAGDDPRAKVRGPLQEVLWKDLFESYDAGATGLPHVVMHPFMDLRVAAFLQSLPPVPWCVEKHILRRAGEGLLPPEIRRRPKIALAADPLQARGAEVAAALREPDALRGLERWVAVDQLQLLDVAEGTTVSWSTARLASLARWLHPQERSDAPDGPIPVIPWKGASNVRKEAVP
ncbi:MAG TPA: asparagine synthase-related protein, partial [Longimicrobium sp.]|nr:asparagine synthase-related protein [Longimicrobium sp.]